ncbi:MAG: hypothetical protein K9G67_09140 [Bacteroidales bacterium]|nr:hypothetical protein [Bacteroidales bacterium]MCF8351515.1 hypothetical protein [Bacteroidales bacterium]MCF8376506.1 hypothetical protein [Bacteroidales bacterium]
MKSGIITPMLLIAFVFQMTSAQAFAPAKKDMVVSGIPPKKVWSIVRYALDEEGIAVGKFDEKNNMLWSRPFDYKFLASDYRAKFVFTYQDGDLIIDMDDFYYKNNGRWETAELNTSFVKANKLKKNMGKRIEELFTQPELMDKVMAKYPEKKEEPVDFFIEGKTAGMFMKLTNEKNTFMVLQSDGAVVTYKLNNAGTTLLWMAYQKERDGETFVLGLNDQGQPDWAVVGEYMAFYNKVSEDVTNLVLVDPDGTYELAHMESITGDYVDGPVIEIESTGKGPSMTLLTAASLPDLKDIFNQSNWKLGGRLLNYTSCGLSLLGGPVAAILPCGSLAIGEFLEFKRDDLDPKTVELLTAVQKVCDVLGGINFKNLAKLKNFQGMGDLFKKLFAAIEKPFSKKNPDLEDIAGDIISVVSSLHSGIDNTYNTSKKQIEDFKNSLDFEQIRIDLERKPVYDATPLPEFEEEEEEVETGPTEEEINAQIEENTGDPESKLCEVLNDPSLGAWEFAREYIKAFYDSAKIDCFTKAFYQFDEAPEEEKEFARLFLKEMQKDVNKRLDGLRGIYKMKLLEDKGSEVEYDIWVIYNNGKKDNFEVTVIKVGDLWRGKEINLDLF